MKNHKVLTPTSLFSDESTTREDEELVKKYSDKITRQTNGQPQNHPSRKNLLAKSRSNLPVSGAIIDISFNVFQTTNTPLSPPNALRVVVSAPGGESR